MLARFNDTQRPGVYRMSPQSGESIHFVAETERAESDVILLDEIQLQNVADGMSATVIESAEEYLEQDHLRRHGRDIWKWMLTGLLVFMFIELLLQQRFARVKA